MVAHMDEANDILNRWPSQHRDSNLSYRFYRSMTLWAMAETASDDQKEQAQQTALKDLEALLASLEKNQLTATNATERRLLKGMALAFAARIYLQQGDWLDAYSYGRAGRDILQQLIQDHPDTEDAYLILGLYEYYTGSVPWGLKWLTRLIDLDGDATLGLMYLERAAQHAPVSGPEAARMLLNGVPFVPVQGCAYLGLAAAMRDYYHTQPYYSFDLQQRYMSCGHPDKALAENRRLSQQTAEDLNEQERRTNQYLALYAARDLGQIATIEQLKHEFADDVPFWTLLKAQTLDVAGQRAQALAFYKKLDHMPSAPWIEESGEAYTKTPYQPPAIEYQHKQITLSLPCNEVTP